MKRALQIILSVLTFFAVFYFVSYVPFAWIKAIQGNGLLRTLLSLFIALAAGFFVLRKLENTSDNLAKSIVMGGLITGSVCFIIGFIGPIIFNPSSNLGPLLGLFITGPVGFLLGLVGGAIYWKAKQADKKEKILQDAADPWKSQS